MVGDHNPNPDFNCTWIGVWRYPSDRNCRNTNLMPMTHVPEIGTEYRYQKTGTISRHENRALSYLLPKTSTRKIWYQIACQMHQKPVPVFWYWFSVPICGMCVIGISCGLLCDVAAGNLLDIWAVSRQTSSPVSWRERTWQSIHYIYYVFHIGFCTKLLSSSTEHLQF